MNLNSNVPSRMSHAMSLCVVNWLRYWHCHCHCIVLITGSTQIEADRSKMHTSDGACVFVHLAAVLLWHLAEGKRSAERRRRRQNCQKIIDFLHEQTANEIKEKTHLKSHRALALREACERYGQERKDCLRQTMVVEKVRFCLAVVVDSLALVMLRIIAQLRASGGSCYLESRQRWGNIR